MKLVYVAGKYRGLTGWKVEQNIREAEEVGFNIAAEYGVVPVIPHTMYRHFDGELSDDFWLKGTLEVMKRCDAVMLCPNWKESQGAIGEVQGAVEEGIPTFEWPKDLSAFEKWLKS